jgi:dihydrofolate synthase/folylpolyglutamate synthase
VRIDGRPIGCGEAARRVEELLAAFARKGAPETTFFELTTLLAIEAYRDHRCDITVLEVGLGGRLDATNAVTPLCSVITSVALDHMHILGDSTAAIAREKAGILKRGVPAVIGVRDLAAQRVIASRARKVGAPLSLIDRDFAARPQARGKRFDVRVGARTLRGLRVRLPGAHQYDNAACAVAAVSALRVAGLAIGERDVRRGLGAVRWPGRLERVAGRPSFLFDAAHNADGCAALAAFLRGKGGKAGRRRARRVLVFGAMADKQYPEMVALLAPLCDAVFYCPPNLRRAATHVQMSKIAKGTRTRNVADALARARRAAGRNGEVIVAGSIFLVAEARAQVLGVASDPLIRM